MKIAIAALAFALLTPVQALPSQDPFDAFSKATIGTWNCSSTTAGKTTTYTSNWQRLAGTAWLQGINRSGSSQSIDMETYDAKAQMWRIVDIEPSGTVSILEGKSADPFHITTHSVYPDRTQTVRYDRVSNRAYTLTFDFILSGKNAHWVDTCEASAVR